MTVFEAFFRPPPGSIICSHAFLGAIPGLSLL